MKFEQLGPYRIGRPLGRGGMGTVYEAVNLETAEPAAIKLLSPSLAGVGGFRDRFAAEIAALRKLRHPNIVRLFGFGEQDGRLYYAMELVDGPSLEGQLLAGKRFAWRDVADIGIQVCRALRHAHDRGVIHRDIKPANLLMDSGEQVKLSDFGIARLFGNTRMTNPGSVMGTAEYMAPEQAEGSAVGPRSDLYSLGAVMYSLLARRPVFQGRSLVEVLQKQRYETPEPLRQYAPEVPEPFEEIVTQLLEKSPDDRIRTPMILSKQLTAMLEAVLPENDVAPAADRAGDADSADSANASDGDAPAAKEPAAPLPPTRISGDANAQPSAEAPEPDPEPVSPDRLTATLVTGAFDRMQPAQPPPGDDEGLTCETPPLPTRAGQARSAENHFTPVAEEDLDRAEIQPHPPALISLHTWILAAALLGVGLVVWYLLQPPTADALYERVMHAAAAASIEALVAAEDDVHDFLVRYSTDPRAQELRRLQQDIDLHHLERKYELRSRGFVRGDQFLPVERDYLIAIQYARLDPELGIARLHALVDLYGPAEEAAGPWGQCVELAARRLASLREQVEEQAAPHLAMIEQRLAKAEKLAAEEPARAAAMYRAVIEMYADRPWAADAVAKARKALHDMPSP